MRGLRDRRSDRERITGVALGALKFPALFPGQGMYRAWGVMPGKSDLGPVAWKSASYKRDEVPPDGSLVLCDTNPDHKWGVSFFEGFVPLSEGDQGHPDGWVLREPGTENLLNMANEGFTVLVGIPPTQILEGRQHTFWRDLWDVTHREDSRWLKPQDITFDTRFRGREATVTFRRHIWFQRRSPGPGSEVLDVPLTMKFTLPEKRTRKGLRDLEEQIRAAEATHVWNPETP